MNTLKKSLTVFIALTVAAAFSTPAMAAKKSKVEKQWYVQMVLMVENDSELYYDNRSGVFGRYPGASNRLDKRDKGMFAPVETANFAFPNGSPAAITMQVKGEGERQFYSNYQKPGKQHRSWDFTVHSSLGNGEATLYWQGPYDLSGSRPVIVPGSALLKQLWLIDRETGEVIDAKEGTYSFDLNGKTKRHFRWVQKKIKSRDLALKPAENKDINAQRINAEAIHTPRPGDFGMPPAIAPVKQQGAVGSSRPVERQK